VAPVPAPSIRGAGVVGGMGDGAGGDLALVVSLTAAPALVDVLTALVSQAPTVRQRAKDVLAAAAAASGGWPRPSPK
jgi:hypothetical protein